jgi:hypothetical protein
MMTLRKGFCRVMIGMVAGLSVLSSGCLGTAEESTAVDSVVPEDEPLPGPLSGPGGSGGMNGFNPLGFHLYKSTVYGSMGADLAELLPMLGWRIRNTTPNQTLLVDLLEGRETLEYAVRCGLASGDAVSGGVPLATFTGQGVLTTTTEWKTKPLSTARKEDLFSCMLAHLNSLDIQVPMMLSGPSIYNSPTFDGSAYEFEEALWGTAITDNGGTPVFNFYVWPSQELDDYCLVDLTGVLNLRLCGSFVGPCNLTVRTDRTTACTETTKGFECDGKPAIQTRLRPVDLPLLYGVCLP